MVQLKDIDARLKELGITNRYWCRAEARELQHILMPDEKINHVVNGRYEGGFAMLVATDFRLLLIDKKPLFLSLEDIRYEMVAEVDYNARLVDATVRILTVNKTLRFTSMRQRRLRTLTTYVQQRVMDARQQQFAQSFQQQDLTQFQQPVPQFNQQVQWSTSVNAQPPRITMPNIRRRIPFNPYKLGAFTTRRHFLTSTHDRELRMPPPAHN